MRYFEQPEELIQEIENQCVQLANKGVNPEIVVLGKYSYFLLKDHYQRKINPNFPQYKNLIYHDFIGFKLRIHVQLEELEQGSTHKIENCYVKVYG